ncbi:hypothetical protein POSPLADRAFT_1045906 [Postia placenta MAD-698-R-SB12]|uniref:Uncharacterized protein n=1 Tax=Postia placenta MAD-698-R-SB12 TaxID=670580 RepID=A0A1X6N4S1_9APHY|nr:hypothetical protein POSPLADRAFT_1045906 [Postia placenta MAD-698-R-SB12]OSX63605.1 hypothetical protein POSPLADRAFT_1045906 [Postia placenta MAD-698-R-SB12]
MRLLKAWRPVPCTPTLTLTSVPSTATGCVSTIEDHRTLKSSPAGLYIIARGFRDVFVDGGELSKATGRVCTPRKTTSLM